MIQNQKFNDMERFAPCEDMICYDAPHDFFNELKYIENEIEFDSISIVYITFKYILYLLFGFTILTLGCSISTLIVMATDKRNSLEEEHDDDGDREDDDDSESDSEDTETNYTHKYVKELNSLLSAVENNKNGDGHGYGSTNQIEESLKESLQSLSDRILMETTPKGNVIMYYNHDSDEEVRSSFHYYCDDKSIPFNYLDTVSRKYVCLYKCPQIYRYLEKEMEVGIQKMKDIESKREEEEKEISKQSEKTEESIMNSRKRSESVFATLKNYKTQSQNQIISGVNGGRTGTKRVINPNQLLLCKNRYKRLGSIEDYHQDLKMKKIKEQEPVNIKPISFSDYKKMNQM
jgi:hypothetical protein